MMFFLNYEMSQCESGYDVKGALKDQTQGSAQYRQTIHHINKFQSIHNILDSFLDLFLD